jgi:uroporphyrinogen-III synthase
MFAENKIDMITFTSSSTAAHFVRMFPNDDVRALIGRAAVACIGPITGKTAEELGLCPDIVSKEYTIAGLVREIVTYFARVNA